MIGALCEMERPPTLLFMIVTHGEHIPFTYAQHVAITRTNTTFDSDSVLYAQAQHNIIIISVGGIYWHSPLTYSAMRV